MPLGKEGKWSAEDTQTYTSQTFLKPNKQRVIECSPWLKAGSYANTCQTDTREVPGLA